MAIERKIFLNINRNLTLSHALCFYGTYRQYFLKCFKVILEVNSTCQAELLPPIKTTNILKIFYYTK